MFVRLPDVLNMINIYYLTTGGLLQTADHIQGRTFTTAGGSQKTDQLAIRDFEGEIVNSNDFFSNLLIAAGEDFCQVLQYYFHTESLPS